jgi:hypothetical protein
MRPFMAPRSSTLGLAAILCVASGLAWAGASVDGPYVGDAFGPVTLRSQGEHVVGAPEAEGPCGFESHQTVLEGELQGDHVFVGAVTLCQEGPSCGSPASYPVLLVFNPEDRVLTGTVRLQKGCESRALGKNGLVVLRATARGAPVPAPVAAEEEDEAPPPPTPGPKASGSAASVAVLRRGPEVDGASALEQGQRALARGQYTEALNALEKARDVNALQPEPHFWLACVQLRLGNRARALESLQRATRLGWLPPEGHRLAAAELKNLAEAGGPEIEALVKPLRGRKRAPGREAQGSGSANP